jgi:hypothetical protein
MAATPYFAYLSGFNLAEEDFILRKVSETTD